MVETGPQAVTGVLGVEPTPLTAESEVEGEDLNYRLSWNPLRNLELKLIPGNWTNLAVW